MDHQKLFAIMSGSDRSAKAHLMRPGLWCAGVFYRCGICVRNRMYDWGILKSNKLSRPTISVGNITTGGTGKTPMVIALVKKLLAMGEKPAVLLRGYAANEQQQSDEVDVLRKELPDTVPVVANASRIAGANEALSTDPAVTTYILDDGFQHRRVQRDLDIVLLDATNPFGFNHILPRGLLRESKLNLRRADAVIITHCEQTDSNSLHELDEQVETITGRRPVAHVAALWTNLRDIDEREVPLDHLQSQHVLGVSGIGNPNAFNAMLGEHCQHAESMTFADHHAYTPDDLQAIAQHAVALNCDAIVTTEKDWVKWRAHWQELQTLIPVYRPILELQFTDGEAELNELIGKRIPTDNACRSTPTKLHE